MRLSFMTWVCPSWSVERIAEFTATSAYDGVEFRVEKDHAHGVEPDTSRATRAAIVDRLGTRGVDVAAIATSAHLADTDDATRATAIESTKANAELANAKETPWTSIKKVGRKVLTPLAATTYSE